MPPRLGSSRQRLELRELSRQLVLIPGRPKSVILLSHCQAKYTQMADDENDLKLLLVRCNLGLDSALYYPIVN